MRVSFLPPVMVAALLLSSCRDAQIETYRVPSEKPEPLPPVLTGAAGTPTTAPAPDTGGGSAMANTAVRTASGAGLTWTAPSHWKAKPSSPMRKGSYAIVGDDGKEADFSITAFPGDVGGELANVNRWRGQISLPPVSAAEVAGFRSQVEHGGLTFTVVEFANTAPEPLRVLGAFASFQGATWFFKLTGPDALVAREKAAFLDLLRTVKQPDPAP